VFVLDDNKTREGGLRFVQMQFDRTTGVVSLALVCNAADLKDTHLALTLLTNELLKLDNTLWHGIWCHSNNGMGNNIFHRSPKQWHRLTGHENSCGSLCIPVGNHGIFIFHHLYFAREIWVDSISWLWM
jgi:hypothetical protein